MRGLHAFMGIAEIPFRRYKKLHEFMGIADSRNFTKITRVSKIFIKITDSGDFIKITEFRRFHKYYRVLRVS